MGCCPAGAEIAGTVGRKDSIEAAPSRSGRDNEASKRNVGARLQGPCSEFRVYAVRLRPRLSDRLKAELQTSRLALLHRASWVRSSAFTRSDFGRISQTA